MTNLGTTNHFEVEIETGPVSLVKKDQKCSFCGTCFATGWWRGAEDVFCCPTCATRTLPKLIADSLNYNNAEFGDSPIKIRDKIFLEFLYAYSLNLRRAWKNTQKNAIAAALK